MPNLHNIQYKVMDRLKSFFGSKPPNVYEEEEDYTPLSFTERQKLRLFGRDWSTSKLMKYMDPTAKPADTAFVKEILAERGLLVLVDKQPAWKVACDIHRPRTAKEIEYAQQMAEVWRQQGYDSGGRSTSPYEPPKPVDPNKQYMWQNLDFSGDLYSQHIRSTCRSTSRKLSDLPEYPPVRHDMPACPPILKEPSEAADTAAEDEEEEAAAEEEALGDDTAAAVEAHVAAAAAGASAAAEAGDQADQDEDQDEDQIRASQPEVMAAWEAAAPYEIDSRSSPTPEQLRKSSKSMSMSVTQQLQQLRAASKTSDQLQQLRVGSKTADQLQQLRAASKTSGQVVVQSGVAC